MNKTEFINYIAEKMETTKVEASQFLDVFVDGIQENIMSEDGIKISGLGSFSRVKRKARIARNPQTGEEIKVPAKWAPVFKSSSQLKEAVKEKKKRRK